MSGLCVRADGDEDPNAGLEDRMQLKTKALLQAWKQNMKKNTGII